MIQLTWTCIELVSIKHKLKHCYRYLIFHIYSAKIRIYYSDNDTWDKFLLIMELFMSLPLVTINWNVYLVDPSRSILVTIKSWQASKDSHSKNIYI